MRRGVLVIAVVCVFLIGASCTKKKPTTPPRSAPAAQPPGLPAEPQEESGHVLGMRETGTCGVHCGTERWRVKTLAGTGGADVDFSPQSTTVRKLTDVAPPQMLSDTRRETDVERRAVQVTALLIGYKREPDGEFTHRLSRLERSRDQNDRRDPRCGHMFLRVFVGACRRVSGGPEGVPEWNQGSQDLEVLQDDAGGRHTNHDDWCADVRSTSRPDRRS